MIKIKLLILLSSVVYISGMDMPQMHNLPNNTEWHSQLFVMVIYNQKEQLLELLRKAGDNAKLLVSSQASNYGTILDAAYIESKQEIREIILHYMSDESLRSCFERRKSELHKMWEYNASLSELQRNTSDEAILRVKSSIDLLKIPAVDLQRCPSAEAIVTDLYKKDPTRYSLTQYECEKLGISRKCE